MECPPCPKCTADVIESISKPKYWKGSSGRIDVTHEMSQIIQILINNSTIRFDLGIGRDVTKCLYKYTKLTVIAVERIENTKLWAKYALEKGLQQIKYKNAPPQSIATPIDEKWMETNFDICPSINEKYLWTGIKPEAVSPIVEEGLDEKLSGLYSNLFGAGIYFAEYASKSDQYMVPDSKGNCFIFLCRVLMGSPYIIKKFVHSKQPIRRIQDIPEVSSKIKNKDLKGPPDSLLAECRRSPNCGDADLERYREMVVYEKNQVYPEFLITLRRE